jgi:predicted transcriptional regulator
VARKSRNHRLDLPPLELECMKALWALGEGTVHAVRSQIFGALPLAYTTIMTIMGRLARKGVVERQKRGRAHVYRPLVAATQVRDHALARLVDNFFLGSREKLQQYLANGGLRAVDRREPGPAARPSPQPRAAPASEEGIDPSLL